MTTTHKFPLQVKEGQRAHFEARIIPVSDPTLSVQWFLNGQPIKQGQRKNYKLEEVGRGGAV